MHRVRTAFLVLVAFGLITDSSALDQDWYRGMNRKKAPEVRQLIEDNLEVGASSEEIEAFLDEHGIVGSYDEFSSRYQAIIRDVAHDPKLDQAVVIHLFVDDNKRFRRAEVSDSFRDNFLHQKEFSISGNQILLLERATSEFRRRLTGLGNYSVTIYAIEDFRVLTFEDPDVSKPRTAPDKLPTLVVTIDGTGKVSGSKVLR